MKIKEILSVLEEMAPLAYAEDFDNVGLLVGNAENEATDHRGRPENADHGAQRVQRVHPVRVADERGFGYAQCVDRFVHG